MAGLPLPRGSDSQKIHERFCVILEACIENNMSKDEILRHVHDKYLIPHEHTNRVWNQLESTNPDLFIAYNSRIRELNPQPSPQEANAVYPTSQAGPSRASNANAKATENQNLQTSQQQQQPVIPNDFCQQVLNALSQIIKLLSDGRGRENEEGEKLQENESGGNEEAEKQITEKEEGKDEEAEKLQEKEEGNNDELQKKEEGDNEEAA